MWSMRHVTFFMLLCLHLLRGHAKPTVDPGLFMILGVETCRGGDGYCLLGLDCTLDDDFLPDDTNGHCNGLKNAFTPTAHFTCCKYDTARDNIPTSKRPRPGVKSTTTTTTTMTTPALTPTTSDSTSTSTSISTSISTMSTATTTQPTTAEPPTTIITTTMSSDTSTDPINLTTVTWEDSDVFVDVNNEVFKEVTPPSLDKEKPT